MGSDYLLSPLEFLVSTLFELYILALLLRFMLQQVRADFYNPVSQFLVRVTNPPLRPLRRMIPGWRGIDIASLVLLLALQLLLLYLLVMLRGQFPSPIGMIFLALAELLSLTLNIYIFALLIQAILSWVNPGSYHPVNGLLYSLNEPLLRPARRLLPPISGLDLSPLVVLLALQVAKMLLIPPLRQLAAIGW